MEKLVDKAKSNDKDAYTELILEVKNDLYKIAKTRLKYDDDVQDIIQDTILEAFNNIGKLKDNTKFKYWIIKILINKCNKEYKKQNHNNITFLYSDDNNYITSNNNITELENTLNFFDMIKSLNSDEKLIIILFYNNKYSIKEISELLKINENTVKSKLLRAKEKIRQNYKGGVKYE